MATWTEFRRAAPDIEAAGRALLYQHGVGLGYLATVGLRGSPRVHPVCPLLDARKGEVYCAVYRWREDRMERQSDYLALPPRMAAERLTPPIVAIVS